VELEVVDEVQNWSKKKFWKTFRKMAKYRDSMPIFAWKAMI